MEIERALRALAQRLHSRRVSGEVMLVGGAAMCLAYAARAMTRDVDAVFEPKTIISEESQRVAEEQGLNPDWLNDAAKGFLSPLLPAGRQVVFTYPGLQVWAPPPDYIFAMKCLAARVEDREDVVTLARMLDLRTYAEAATVILRYYPAGKILPKTRFMLEGLFGADA